MKCLHVSKIKHANFAHYYTVLRLKTIYHSPRICAMISELKYIINYLDEVESCIFEGQVMNKIFQNACPKYICLMRMCMHLNISDLMHVRNLQV